MSSRPDFFVPQAHRILARYAQVKHVTFWVHAAMVTPDEIFCPEGLLPLIAMYAHARMREHASARAGQEREWLAAGLPMQLTPDENALLGQRVDLALLTGPEDPLAVLRLLYLTEAADTLLGLDDNVEVDVWPVLEMFGPHADGDVSRIAKWPLTKVNSPR
jgi:hypothetical protein